MDGGRRSLSLKRLASLIHCRRSAAVAVRSQSMSPMKSSHAVFLRPASKKGVLSAEPCLMARIVAAV